jgi:hypothetical protein
MDLAALCPEVAADVARATAEAKEIVQGTRSELQAAMAPGWATMRVIGARRGEPVIEAVGVRKAGAEIPAMPLKAFVSAAAGVGWATVRFPKTLGDGRPATVYDRLLLCRSLARVLPEASERLAGFSARVFLSGGWRPADKEFVMKTGVRSVFVDVRFAGARSDATGPIDAAAAAKRDDEAHRDAAMADEKAKGHDARILVAPGGGTTWMDTLARVAGKLGTLVATCAALGCVVLAVSPSSSVPAAPVVKLGPLALLTAALVV